MNGPKDGTLVPSSILRGRRETNAISVAQFNLSVPVRSEHPPPLLGSCWETRDVEHSSATPKASVGSKLYYLFREILGFFGALLVCFLIQLYIPVFIITSPLLLNL